MIRSEQEKLKHIVDGLSEHLKSGLNSEVFNMTMPEQSASELKVLINEMRDALHKMRPDKRLSAKVEECFKIPRRCADLYSDLKFYVFAATSLLVLQGYLVPKFNDPTPFNSRDTAAGDILFTGYEFGLHVSTSHQFGQNFISSLLSSNVEALESNILVKHIRDRWSTQIDIIPGQNVVLKGAVEKLWGGNLKLSLDLPYNGQDRKLGFLQNHKFGSLGGSIGLTANPILNLCALFGSKKINAGFIIDYQTVPGTLNSIATGGAWNTDNFCLSAMLESQFEEHEGAYERRIIPSCTAYYKVSDATSLAAQLVHRVEDHRTTYIAGVLHVVDSTTSVKARLTNDWVISSWMKHKFSGWSLSLCSQFDLKTPQEPPRIGVSVSIGN